MCCTSIQRLGLAMYPNVGFGNGRLTFRRLFFFVALAEARSYSAQGMRTVGCRVLVRWGREG